MPQQSLKDKTIKGTAWSAADAFLGQGVTFLVGIVLARLLSPDEYGLIGIITIFTTVCTTIINGGFSNALIRTKDPSEDDYNTAFIINLGLSLVLYAVVFLCKSTDCQLLQKRRTHLPYSCFFFDDDNRSNFIGTASSIDQTY